MVQTVCLDEEEDAVATLRGFKQMNRVHDLCDFIIEVEGVKYQTHRNILSVGSPYFKEMFEHDTAENREGKVEMKNIDPECVKSCIDFLYSGKFDIPDGKMGQLLHVAILLQLDKVKNAISDILNRSLNAGNFYETRDIAKMYDLQTVSKSCRTYYEKYFMAISLQPGFQNEKIPDLVSILQSENLKLSDQEKLTVSLRWVGGHPSKKENVLELVKLINLKDVSSEYLSDILVNDPVIGNDFRLYELITASCIEKAIKKYHNKRDIYRNQIVIFDRNADCLRSYDPATGEVAFFHNEKYKPRGFYTAVTMESYIYVLYDDKSVHRFDFLDKNSKWEKMQNMIADHGDCPPVVSLLGSLFAIGSDCDSVSCLPVKDVEIFIPAANRWLKLNDQPEARLCQSLVSLNNSIYCIGGFGDGKALNSFCRFTPSTSEWVDLEPMKDGRFLCSAVASEQRIFVMGGHGDYYEPLTDVECYDVNSKLWTSLTQTIVPHYLCSAHHIDGWIFVLRKWYFKRPPEVVKYDISNDQWYKVEFKEVRRFEICDSVLIQI